MKGFIFVLLGLLYFIVLIRGGSVTLGINVIPEWDLCVNGGDIFSCSGHGQCSGGKCACTDGYTGRDCSVPPGGFKYATPATVTQFCQLETGGCAAGMCVGGGQFDGSNLPPGVDGVAALNPTLYGSRYAYAAGSGMGVPNTLNGMYSFVGQSCGTCWKLTRASVSIVVTVVDRCAGYCRATTTSPQTCSASADGGKECGECIQAGQTSAPQCSCLSSDHTAGWCGGVATAHCDWCAANDHPHFDLDITAQMKICGDQAYSGLCSIDSFQMVACPDMLGPWPNGYFNKTKAPTSSGSPSGGSTQTQSGNAAASCGPVLDSAGTCKTVKEGDYMCNGCNLTMCHNGKFANLGCPRGTVCKNGECVLGTTCDSGLTTCTAASTPAPATSAPVTSAPTQKATSAPGSAATTKPTSAPTQKATDAPATSAPTAPPKKCRRKITQTAPAEESAKSAVAEPALLAAEPSKAEFAGAELSKVEFAAAQPVSAAPRSLSSVFSVVLGIFAIIFALNN